MSVSTRIWLSLLLAVTLAYGSYSLWQTWRKYGEGLSTDASHGESPRGKRHLADFSFTERSGKRVSLASMEGRVWVASFFFASCPSFCKQMNQSIAQLESEFGPRGVRFVSITVDPLHDTPEALASYAEALGASQENWLFLTGDFQDVEELGMNVFQVSVARQEHSDRLIIIDQAGKIRGTYHSQVPAELMTVKDKLEEVLSEAAADPSAGGSAPAPSSAAPETTSEPKAAAP